MTITTKTSQKIKAIFSDYDGTLVPAADVKNTKTNAAAVIPAELEGILKKVSAEIPVCIISTKDYEFLRNKTTTFAWVLSCIMGIETLVLTTNNNKEPSDRVIKKRLLETGLEELQLNSEALSAIAEEIISQEEFSGLFVERKHTTDGILAGLTIDWRHLNDDDWWRYAPGISHFICSMVANLRREPVPVNVYVQKYSTHPFIDVYSIECNKGMAFDTVISQLTEDDDNTSIDCGNVLYLGDSENDNLAFRKAGISIGIRSDKRLNPKLDCSYLLSYGELFSFLARLRENNYIFTDRLLVTHGYE